MSSSAESLALWVIGALAVATMLLVALVVMKSRRFREGEVFAASRWTRGNRLFPTQVAIGPDGVVQHKAQWLGREEQSIHIGHVASVTIDTGLLFSDVVIETSGGSEPIVCHGHSKSDAVRMKQLIDRYQSERFQGAPLAAVGASGVMAAAGDVAPTRVCPYCAETVKAAATVCRYCGRDLPPA